MKKAFTLIELLVVVLIIGILAAVALPQYERAVEKSRVTEAEIMLRTLNEAQKRCILELGDVDECKSGGQDGAENGLFTHMDIYLGELIDDPTNVMSCGDCALDGKHFVYIVEPGGDTVSAIRKNATYELFWDENNTLVCFDHYDNLNEEAPHYCKEAGFPIQNGNRWQRA